jgi:hypothetical protein
VTGTVAQGASGRVPPSRRPAVRSWPPIVAVGTVLFWTIVAGWYDALTYLAAGERLNGGHPLYAIGLGDRIVETAPPFYGPLLSPPLIAVLFRPLALFGLSAMWAWTVALGIVMGATAWHLARTPMAAAFVVLLGAGVGMAAISGNVSTLFIPAYVAIWRWRDRPIVGALVGVMAVTKLLPLVFVGFLMAGRRWRALGWCAAGAGVALLLTVAGAGWDNTVAYLAVAREAVPQPTSLPWLTGLPWLSPVLLAAGTIVASMLGERGAFRLCVITIVFGAPVLTWRELGALLVLLAPSLPEVGTDRVPPTQVDVGSSSFMAQPPT